MQGPISCRYLPKITVFVTHRFTYFTGCCQHKCWMVSSDIWPRAEFNKACKHKNLLSTTKSCLAKIAIVVTIARTGGTPLILHSNLPSRFFCLIAFYNKAKMLHWCLSKELVNVYSSGMRLFRLLAEFRSFMSAW